ncbi:MAG: alpha/beta hydrolase [candidate division NC10 bacterium]|nr:alpha/beta hydrolase [candidate division NC10 bacterium]
MRQLFGRRTWLEILALAFLIPVLVWVLNGMEKRLIFYPHKTIIATPADEGLAYDDVSFKTSDGVVLNGWFVPGKPGSATLLWFHGNAGNISHRVENITLLHNLLGIHVFIFDYRGYGRSEGKVSEKGTYRDAEAAYTYLRSRKDLDPSKIVFFGRSLGAAVAVEMALRAQCAGLILESPFTSIREIANHVFPLVGFLFRTRYDSLSKIKRIRVPLLILHGDQDEIVPFSMGRRLFEAANEPKEFYRIKGADHNDTYLVGGIAYFEALGRFIETATAGPRPNDQ